MLLSNPARPTTGQNVLERFGLANTSEGISQYSLNQFKDAQGCPSVGVDPVT